MLKWKSFLDFIYLFSPNEYEKNDKITLKYFQWLEIKIFFWLDSKYGWGKHKPRI